MSPNRLGFVIQWPLMGLMTWLFKVKLGWAWAFAGAGGVFAAMILTWLIVMLLAAIRDRPRGSGR